MDIIDYELEQAGVKEPEISDELLQWIDWHGSVGALLELKRVCDAAHENSNPPFARERAEDFESAISVIKNAPISECK